MSNRDGTNGEVLAAQAEMFRVAEQDHGLTLKAISSETGIKLSTLQTWCSSNIFARVRIGLPDFVRLCTVLPDDCTSLVLEPAGKHVGSNESGEGDLHTLTREAADFVSDKLDREADGRLCHIDQAKLKHRARRVASVARSAAQ